MNIFVVFLFLQLMSKFEVISPKQLMFIFMGSSICKFIYSLTFIWSPKSTLQALAQPFTGTCRAGTNLSHPTCTFQAEVKQGGPLPPCFHSQPVNKCPLCSLFSAMFFEFSCFLLIIVLLKIASNHSVEVLSRVPKRTRRLLCALRRRYMC